MRGVGIGVGIGHQVTRLLEAYAQYTASFALLALYVCYQVEGGGIGLGTGARARTCDPEARPGHVSEGRGGADRIASTACPLRTRLYEVETVPALYEGALCVLVCVWQPNHPDESLPSCFLESAAFGRHQIDA